MMFWLGVLLMMSSMCRGGRGQRFFTKNPEGTLAVKGDNVTLTCAVNVQTCEKHQSQYYYLYWQQKLGTQNVGFISNCRSVYPDYTSKNWIVSSSDGYEWNLHFINVDNSAAGKYQCRIVKQHSSSADNSPFATLTVVDPINTAIEPSLQRSQEGQAASFRCLAHVQPTDSYAWFRNINGKWKEIPNSDNFQLSEDKASLTIQRLRPRQNGSQIACDVIRGTTSITRQRQAALLIVDPREETTATFRIRKSPFPDGIAPTPQDGQNGNAVQPSPTEASTNDEAGPSSDKSKPTIFPKTKDHDNSNPSRKPDGLSPILIGGIGAAVVLLLIIAFLLYFLLFKGRGKPDTRPTSQSPETQDSGPRSDDNDTAETQLNVGATAAILQPISPDTNTVEVSKPSTIVAVAVDLTRQSSADQDQGKANKSPTKCAAKLNTVITPAEAKKKGQTIGGNIAEVLFATPDKPFIKTKTLGAVHPQDFSQKVSGQATKQPMDTKQAASKVSKDGIRNQSESKKPTILVKPFTGAGCATLNAGRANTGSATQDAGRTTQDTECVTQDARPSTGVKPPKVVPYHLSKARARSVSQSVPEPTDDRDEEVSVEDPRLKNVEGLIYADLDLRGRGGRQDAGTSIIHTEEEALYADIVNKDTLGKLR